TRAGFANDAQPSRRIGAAERVAVHGGSGEGWLGAPRHDRFGERASECVSERDLFRRRGADVTERDRSGVGDADHGSRTKSPLAPPLLLRTLMSSMIISRSMVLSMSKIVRHAVLTAVSAS